MNSRPMFDRRMLEHLSRFFPSTLRVEATFNTTDAMGSPVEEWELVEDLAFVPCSIAPFNDIIPISGERKLENMNYNTATHRITLKGYYPQITTKMTVVFDDTRHNILGVEHDSHDRTTRIIVNEVTI